MHILVPSLNAEPAVPFCITLERATACLAPSADFHARLALAGPRTTTAALEALTLIHPPPKSFSWSPKSFSGDTLTLIHPPL